MQLRDQDPRRLRGFPSQIRALSKLAQRRRDALAALSKDMQNELDIVRDVSLLQLRDVSNLLSTGGDTDYIEHWTRELGLHSLWLECKP